MIEKKKKKVSRLCTPDLESADQSASAVENQTTKVYRITRNHMRSVYVCDNINNWKASLYFAWYVSFKINNCFAFKLNLEKLKF